MSAIIGKEPSANVIIFIEKMRSRRRRGDAGESLSVQLPSPVAPMRYRGVSIACSTRCILTTPSSICMLGDARTPQAIPRSESLADQELQRNGCQLLGRPFFAQYGHLLPVGSHRRMNQMEPLTECVSMRTSELRWGRLLTRRSYDLVITGSSLCRFRLHCRLEFPSCVLD